MKYFIIDAFTDKVFHGNPAAVFVLEEWLPDEIMQKIAIENNLSETAFTVFNGIDYDLRWFTPDREIDLCGHATLATAYVLFNHYGYDKRTVVFMSQSGPLTVTKKKETYFLDFPTICPNPTPILPEYENAIGAKIKEAYLARDLFFVLENENVITNLDPDFSSLKSFDLGVGVIVTSKGKKSDFVSRAFFPKLTIDEDPVCGSAHSNLIPYWHKQLGKTKLSAVQLSPRGGSLECEYQSSRVIIGGKAILYAVGTINIH